MRLFFFEWSNRELGLTEMIKELGRKGHEIVYISGFKLEENFDRVEFPHTIFHDYHDARAGRPSPQVDATVFPPPGEDLLKELVDVESTILVLMNKRFEWMGENQKKHLYYTYVQYWDGVIKKYQPDAIIMPSAPHTIYDLVVYGLNKLYGIKTIIFELTAIYDRSIIMNDYVKGFARLQETLLENKGKNFSVVDLEEDIRKYYANQTNPHESSTPYIIKSLGDIYSPKNIAKAKSTALWRSLRDRVFWERLGQRIMRIGKGSPQKEYESLQVEPNFSKKYIYMPLHYQPECSTCPLGGVFVDQLLAIKILSYCLPEDWLIYIKEQPFQWKPRGPVYFKYRFEGYYKIIAGLSNVRLVPIATDTFRLIANAAAVASVSGTAPWEGLFRDKPGIFFGYPWYRDCPGLFKVTDVASGKEALEKIKNGFRPDKQELLNYLISFQKVSPKLFRFPHLKILSALSVEENIKNHVDAITRELEQISA